MEKVLVLGNKGMLGHVLYEAFQANDNTKKYDVIGINRSVDNTDNNSYTLDALNLDKLDRFIKNQEPKYIVNCIGSLVEASINKPSLAIQTNSLLPHFLNEISEKYNFKLIHISTDCVFDGKKGKYKESDKKTETNYYGLTKNLGEINNSRNLTIRTSIIGPELKLKPTGLFDWIMSQKTKTINGYSNAIWSGLTTLELSKFIIWSLDKDINGIVHATNSIGISKYDLVKLTDQVFDLKINLLKNKDYKIDKTLLNTNINNYNFPAYIKMIHDMKDWIDNHNNLYNYKKT
jgi:dTDP-4-dehydrorhamnose reductase